MAEKQSIEHAEISSEAKAEGDLIGNAATLKREKRLVRKLDLTLMPMVWILYLFSYLDRNNIAQAKLSSFEADLGLKGTQYNTVISILNVGYMLMQLPSNMIITRVRPSIYIPAWVCVWSCISAATGSIHSYPHLIAVRLFLGASEAPFSSFSLEQQYSQAWRELVGWLGGAGCSLLKAPPVSLLVWWLSSFFRIFQGK